MYIPAFNRATDDDEVLAFMKRYAFATLVTAKDGLPTATHLPFSVDRRGEELFLTSHFARANPQWKDLESHKSLVIFSEPHAYISPQHYDHSTNVPTWNYIAVHAYGDGRLLTDPSDAVRVLEGMIDTYEAGYRDQWNALPDDYRMKSKRPKVCVLSDCTQCPIGILFSPVCNGSIDPCGCRVASCQS